MKATPEMIEAGAAEIWRGWHDVRQTAKPFSEVAKPVQEQLRREAERLYDIMTEAREML